MPQIHDENKKSFKKPMFSLNSFLAYKLDTAADVQSENLKANLKAQSVTPFLNVVSC